MYSQPLSAWTPVARLRIEFLIELTSEVGPIMQLDPVSVRAFASYIMYSVLSFMLLPHLRPYIKAVHQ